jgi:hypothetical protein
MIAEAEVRALAEGEVSPRPEARTLRRDESVIAEAVRLRGTPGQRFADGLRAMLDRAIATARRGAAGLSRLSLPARIGVVAAPLVLLLGVAAAALWPAPIPSTVAESPAPSAAPARVFVSRALDPATLPSPVAPGPAPAAAPPTAAPAAAPVVSLAPSPTALAPAADPAPTALDRLRQQGPPATPLSVAEAVRTLPSRASLYAAPKKGAPRTVSLAAGVEVLTYPGVPVPEGWVVARKPDGEIGFLRTSALEPKPVPATVPKLPKLKRRNLDDDEALPRARADDRPRRRELDEGDLPKRRAAPAAKPKRAVSGGKPLTADDLLLR